MDTERRLRERSFRVDVPMPLDLLVTMLVAESGMRSSDIMVTGRAVWQTPETDDEVWRRERAMARRRAEDI